MAASTLNLSHSQVTFTSIPHRQLEFQGDGFSVKLGNYGIQNLMVVLPTVMAKVSEAKASQQDLKDGSICSYNISMNKSKCVNIETTVFKNQVYTFFKSYFKEKKGKNVNSKGQEEQDLVEDDVSAEFKQLAECIKDGETGKDWVPNSGNVRLELQDMQMLGKFIVEQYKQLLATQ